MRRPANQRAVRRSSPDPPRSGSRPSLYRSSSSGRPPAGGGPSARAALGGGAARDDHAPGGAEALAPGEEPAPLAGGKLAGVPGGPVHAGPEGGQPPPAHDTLAEERAPFGPAGAGQHRLE